MPFFDDMCRFLMINFDILDVIFTFVLALSVPIHLATT